MQEHWASFWEHVDDLRQTLLKSLIIVGVGFIVILGFYQPFMQFLTHYPMESAASNLLKRRVERIQVINQTDKDQQFELPADAWMISDQLPDNPLGKSRHYRLVPGQALLYEQVIYSPLLIMGPLEGLLLVFKVCFWLSMALTAPFWGWVWLQFILPGLKAQERAMLLPFFLCSAISLGLGVVLAYTVTLPIANQYLMLFNGSIGQNAWTLMHYVDYVLLLCLGHAIAAELGLLLLLLVHFQLLSPEWLIAKRRYMIVVAFILGALLTPPDVLTQLLLAIPLMGLYEIAICYAKWRKRQAESKALG